jgi:hypothetical protein
MFLKLVFSAKENCFRNVQKLQLVRCIILIGHQNESTIFGNYREFFNCSPSAK